MEFVSTETTSNEVEVKSPDSLRRSFLFVFVSSLGSLVPLAASRSCRYSFFVLTAMVLCAECDGDNGMGNKEKVQRR